MNTLFSVSDTAPAQHAMPESYLPLYRKYRPQALNELVGQEAMAQALTNAIALNQVSHAYLFTGPRGTGKTSTARIFAKSLNCTTGPTATPCQVCDACVNITAGNGLDVVEYDAASNSGVEEARELIESCQFAPIAGRYKIYIIDEVHMLSKAAFNALLKTLEEPPPNVIFIFATTEAHKVLPTILSRCQRFDFKRIALATIEKHLHWVCEQEGLTIADDALLFIARSAKGGMRDALSMLDQTAVLARSEANAGKPLALATLVAFLGYLSEDKLIGLLQVVASQQGMQVLETYHAILQQGVDAFQVVKQLMQVFRQLLLFLTATQYATTPRHSEELLSFLDCSSIVLDGLEQVKTSFSTEEIPPLLRQLQTIEGDMRHASDPTGVLELGLLSLTFRDKLNTVEALQQRLTTLESALKQLQQQVQTGAVVSAVAPATMPAVANKATYQPSGGGAMPAPLGITTAPNVNASPIPASSAVQQAAPPTVASSSPPASGGDLGLLTQQIVGAITSPGAKALFRLVTLLSYEGNKLLFGVASAAILKTIQAPDKLVHVQKACEAVFNQPMQIAFTTDKTPPPSTNFATTPPASVTATALPTPQPAVAPPPTASFETLTAIPFEEEPSVQPHSVAQPPSKPPAGGMPPPLMPQQPQRPPANGMPAPLPVAKPQQANTTLTAQQPHQNDEYDELPSPPPEDDLWGGEPDTSPIVDTLVANIQPATPTTDNAQSWEESVGFAQQLLSAKIIDT